MLFGKENPHGGDIYGQKVRLDFSSNINPLGTPESVVAAASAAANKLRHYPDPFCRELVAAISSHEGVPHDFILCGNGSAELIYAFCRAASVRKAVITAPAFSEYAAALRSVGAEVAEYTLNPNTGFELDDGFLDFIAASDADAVFVCNPNNPTGRLAQPALMKNLAALCLEKNIRLFADECFLDFCENAGSLKNEACGNDRLFILKAFTKNYALAGLRLGYCICFDKALLKRISEQTQPWNISTPAQRAGIAALKETEYLEKARRLICEEREFLSERLSALSFYVCPSDANFVLFHGPCGLDRELLERGILIRSCANFSGLSPGWYRAAVRLRAENEELINTVKSICEDKKWQKA